MSAMRKGIDASKLEAFAATGTETGARRYRFGPGFIGFSGHFPGNPILPAIVQIRAVVSLAEAESGKTLRLAAVRSAKFLSPIRPDEDVWIRYRRRVDSGMDICDAALSVAEKTVAAFQLELAEGETPR
ncbi:3-hydroxyacyl-ACP dehydratase [Candidatus Deferrimicrobium sp.]|uniref:3-hydroxyacyl-ACP dehydratase n=1 Tax=Candidatus Deferrimicrobium sp. TaxID=3060586 RepID=UPI003C5ADED9